jgi:hypothetical protein
MKMKLLGILDGSSGQLHAVATFFTQQMASISKVQEAGAAWVIFCCPSMTYHLLKC